MKFYLIKNRKTSMFLNAQGKYVQHPAEAIWYRGFEPAKSEYDRRAYCEPGLELFEMQVTKVLV